MTLSKHKLLKNQVDATEDAPEIDPEELEKLEELEANKVLEEIE